MNCHSPCGACCIAPAITSSLPNMPNGKPAGIRCVNLNDTLSCTVYEIRPAVCRDFIASDYSCGANHAEALVLLGELEHATGDRPHT